MKNVPLGIIANSGQSGQSRSGAPRLRLSAAFGGSPSKRGLAAPELSAWAALGFLAWAAQRPPVSLHAMGSRQVRRRWRLKTPAEFHLTTAPQRHLVAMASQSEFSDADDRPRDGPGRGRFRAIHRSSCHDGACVGDGTWGDCTWGDGTWGGGTCRRRAPGQTAHGETGTGETAPGETAPAEWARSGNRARCDRLGRRR